MKDIYVVTELLETDCDSYVKVLGSFIDNKEAIKFRDFKIDCKCKEFSIDPETHDFLFVVSPINDNIYTYDVHPVKCNDFVDDSQIIYMLDMSDYDSVLEDYFSQEEIDTINKNYDRKRIQALLRNKIDIYEWQYIIRDFIKCILLDEK